eukprot:CAMPEP_0114224808 /NCGR_PEP_ID=MMETSP0058-20121206/310_1 /TAXON_ID=36894 /ORGANISM="Pyramimonas parkeae, CCMP726" /LENGTH=452 /DNA_ID=CAMNT_0001335319 /DNA_START=144 /DNA_END=1502 /DNA_ORIENTATION=+
MATAMQSSHQAEILKSFTTWREQNGVKSPSLELAFFEGGVRGVVATQDLVPGDRMVELPRSACIMVGETDKCPFPEFVAEAYWDTLVGNEQAGIQRLALVLLNELKKGSASSYSAYIQQLPQEIYTLGTFTSQQLQELQYPPIIEEGNRARRELRDMHAALKRQSPQTKVSEAEFQWAFLICQTRVFSGAVDLKLKGRLVPKAAAVAMATAAFSSAQNDQGRWIAVTAMAWLLASDFIGKKKGDADGRATYFILMPMIDAINSLSGVKTEFEFSALTDKFVVKAANSYKKGEQAFISYGELSNDTLAVRYGHVQPDNEFDVFVFDDLMGWLRGNYSQAQELTSKHISTLRKEGAIEALDGATLLPNGSMDPSVLRALDMILIATSEGGESSGRDLYKMLAAVCRGSLNDMGTSLQEDKELLETAEDPRLRLAIQFRMEKKKLLQQALSCFQQ